MFFINRVFPNAASQKDTIQTLQTDHDNTIAEIHVEELDRLRHQLADQLKELEDSLNQERDIKMADFRKKLASKQLSEEEALRAKKATSLEELKAKIDEEKEDEEAVLMEEKLDTLRKLKQQVKIITWIFIFRLTGGGGVGGGGGGERH